MGTLIKQNCCSKSSDSMVALDTKLRKSANAITSCVTILLAQCHQLSDFSARAARETSTTMVQASADVIPPMMMDQEWYWGPASR